MLLDDKETILIGISGGSASGKTSIARRIQESYSDSDAVTIIKEDDYYKDQSFLPFEERLKTNYDHPNAFDHDLLIRHLDMLKKGEQIEKPTYDYVHHTRSDVTEIVKPTNVMVLEGLFVLENSAIRERLDIKVFVDTPADIRFIRRLQRDMIERGRSMESVINQYCNTVRVMHEEFIEPTKKYADIIIPSGGRNLVAVDLLETKINSILQNKMIK
ncbi:MAG: uridine kinase [Erysipelotrichaceae bacterium]|nr:uridine kinase [Erysipelotrichaceae bacterium]MBR2552572.1 uridine kinase [Erysipelotrichaceae bacterium]